jgi:hypothetical protein
LLSHVEIVTDWRERQERKTGELRNRRGRLIPANFISRSVPCE